MMIQIEQLIEALREELKQYGELLALLEKQQEYVTARDAVGVEDTAAQVDFQARHLETLKEARDQQRIGLCRGLDLSDDATFRDVIEAMPKVYRPLMEALIDENNQCMARVQRIAKQNHVLLSRSMEMMGQLIRAVCPESATPTVYDGKGQLQGEVVSLEASYEHVC